MLGDLAARELVEHDRLGSLQRVGHVLLAAGLAVGEVKARDLRLAGSPPQHASAGGNRGGRVDFFQTAGGYRLPEGLLGPGGALGGLAAPRGGGGGGGRRGAGGMAVGCMSMRRGERGGGRGGRAEDGALRPPDACHGTSRCSVLR